MRGVGELAIEKGAASILMPIGSRRQLNDLPDDLAARFTTHHYLDANRSAIPSMDSNRTPTGSGFRQCVSRNTGRKLEKYTGAARNQRPIEIASRLKPFTSKPSPPSITPRGPTHPEPTPNSFSTMDSSNLKGPAFPADFSNDVPEYSDEELEEAMKEAEKRILKQRKASKASASSQPPSSTTSPPK
jgi:hypothetical protein